MSAMAKADADAFQASPWFAALNAGVERQRQALLEVWATLRCLSASLNAVDDQLPEEYDGIYLVVDGLIEKVDHIGGQLELAPIMWRSIAAQAREQATEGKGNE